jgi:predicted RNA-binding Zn-ribbon protein involved in translation (DUF1610 family)
MSYFDHVRCHSCRSMLDPEKIGGVGGSQFSCPYCGVELKLRDLFGVKAAFSEDDQQDLSLEDLMRGDLDPNAPEHGSVPGGGGATGPGPAAPRQAPAAPPGSTHLVHTPRDEEEDDAPPPAKGSALAAMRAIKKKR